MNYMRNQKGKKIGLHMLTAALFFVLAMSVCAVKTEAKDYKQGKVYKITAKSKPLKASKFTKSSLYNKKTRMSSSIKTAVPINNILPDIWRNSRKKEKGRLF